MVRHVGPAAELELAESGRALTHLIFLMLAGPHPRSFSCSRGPSPRAAARVAVLAPAAAGAPSLPSRIRNVAMPDTHARTLDVRQRAAQTFGDHDRAMPSAGAA